VAQGCDWAHPRPIGGESCESCRSSHTEHNKIWFAIFVFFYDFIWNLKVSGSTQKGRKNILSQGSLELLDLHKSTPDSNRYTPETNNSHKHAPDDGGKLATGDVGPTQVNMWHRVVIGLTRDLLAVVAGPEWSPVSGGGGAVVAQPRALELRRGWGRG
jgi:hypothetical protein